MECRESALGPDVVLPAPPGFRAHPLDGAILYFDPRTGTHLRVADASTRALRRQAPRVAMFGITNACNLRCAFCSRDAARPSMWPSSTPLCAPCPASTRSCSSPIASAAWPCVRGPAAALTALAAIASAHHVRLTLGVSETDPLGAAIRRMLADVGA